MCGTSIIDRIFFSRSYCTYHGCIHGPQISNYWRWWWWMVINLSFSLLNLVFFFFFFWGIQIFQKMTDSSYFRSNSSASPVWRTDINCNKLLLSSFSGKPLFAQSLQLIPCKWVKWLTSISISLHVEGKGL